MQNYSIVIRVNKPLHFSMSTCYHFQIFLDLKPASGTYADSADPVQTPQGKKWKYNGIFPREPGKIFLSCEEIILFGRYNATFP